MRQAGHRPLYAPSVPPSHLPAARLAVAVEKLLQHSHRPREAAVGDIRQADGFVSGVPPATIKGVTQETCTTRK